MKKWIVLLSGLILFGVVSSLSSCDPDEPTTGILVIQVVDSNGVSVPDVHVVVATSLSNIQQGLYLTDKWTDAKGVVFFADLLPLHYWYGVEGWEDVAGTQVWAGIEHIVTLRLTTPKP